jgi:hypothetical protein
MQEYLEYLDRGYFMSVYDMVLVLCLAGADAAQQGAGGRTATSCSDSRITIASSLQRRHGWAYPIRRLNMEMPRVT